MTYVSHFALSLLVLRLIVYTEYNKLIKVCGFDCYSDIGYPSFQDGDLCYVFFEKKLNMVEAQSYCFDLGLHLPRLKSIQSFSNAMRYGHNFLPNDKPSVWLGIEYHGPQKQYWWEESNEPVNFTSLNAEGLANEDGDQCMIIALSNSRIFKFNCTKNIYVSCMKSQLHWFGPNKTHLCHCRSGGCDERGACREADGRCAKRWFGEGCQYGDIMINFSYNLTDFDDKTCMSIASPFQHYFKSERYITWIRVVSKQPVNKEMFSVAVHVSNVTYECHERQAFMINNYTVDIWCRDHAIRAKALFLRFKGPKTLCSVHIFRGQNVALKQHTSLSSTLGSHNASYAVDGEHGMVSPSAMARLRDTMQTWTLILEPMAIIFEVFVLLKYPECKSMTGVNFILEISPRLTDPSIYVTFSFDGIRNYVSILPTTTEAVKYVNIRMHKTSTDSSKSLDLSEVLVFGACAPPFYGPYCTNVCSTACVRQLCHVNGECLTLNTSVIETTDASSTKQTTVPSIVKTTTASSTIKTTTAPSTIKTTTAPRTIKTTTAPITIKTTTAPSTIKTTTAPSTITKTTASSNMKTTTALGIITTTALSTIKTTTAPSELKTKPSPITIKTAAPDPTKSMVPTSKLTKKSSSDITKRASSTAPIKENRTLTTSTMVTSILCTTAVTNTTAVKSTPRKPTTVKRSDSDCPEGYSGRKCMYLCHCKNRLCDKWGRCRDGSSCAEGWFALQCQYKNLAFNGQTSDPVLNDGDDSTCVIPQDKIATAEVDEPFLFTWIRIVFGPEAQVLNFSLSFYQPETCLSIRVLSEVRNQFDVFCHNEVVTRRIELRWQGAGPVCSLYINGGRNVAINGQFRMYDDKENYYLNFLKDGNITNLQSIDLNADSNNNLTLKFANKMTVYRIELFTDASNGTDTSFILNGTLQDGTVLFQYISTSGERHVVFSSDTLGWSLQNITFLSVEGSLNISEVLVFGDCAPPLFFLGCTEICILTCSRNRCNYNGFCYECPLGSRGDHCMEVLGETENASTPAYDITKKKRNQKKGNQSKYFYVFIPFIGILVTICYKLRDRSSQDKDISKKSVIDHREYTKEKEADTIFDKSSDYIVTEGSSVDIESQYTSEYSTYSFGKQLGGRMENIAARRKATKMKEMNKISRSKQLLNKSSHFISDGSSVDTGTQDTVGSSSYSMETQSDTENTENTSTLVS